jgi:hypothetical protein
MKHILKYKLFEDLYKEFLTEDEVKNFFSNHLNSDRFIKFMNEYNYPFFPIIPNIGYNNDIDKCEYILTYKFVKDNTETIIRYEINYKFVKNIQYTISLQVNYTNEDNTYILIDYYNSDILYKNSDIFSSNIGKDKLLYQMEYKKGYLKFFIPQIKITPEGSMDFLNLKTFLIDLRFMKVLEKYTSGLSPLDSKINTDDKDYYQLVSQLDLTYFQIQKRNGEWVYFNYREVYDFLSKITVSNEFHTELHKQFMIHEQYLYKIVKLYKIIKKEIEDEFNN